MPPLIPQAIHLPVFSVAHTEVRRHHQTTTSNSPPPKRWKFKLQMSLSFRVRLSLPKAFQKWKSRMKSPPLDPIIPVMPNYELMKTPTMSPMPEDHPPSYHLPRYTSHCCTTHHTPPNKTTSFSKPSPPNMTPPMPRLRRSKRITAAKTARTTKMTQAQALGLLPIQNPPVGEVAVN